MNMFHCAVDFRRRSLVHVAMRAGRARGCCTAIVWDKDSRTVVFVARGINLT